MRHLPAALVALLSLLPAPAAAASWTAVEALPGATPVRVLVKERPRTYFRVASGRSLDVTLEGPARVRVVTRAVLPPGATGAVSYHIRLSAAGKRLHESKTESSAAPTASVDGSSERLGKSRTVTVEVPAGRQLLEVAIDGVPAALIRVLVSSPRRAGSEPYVSLTPVEAPRSVTVTEGEKSIPYYSILPGKHVRLRVVGPTTLELSTRLDFDATMRGTQRYRIGVRVGPGAHKETELATTKSTTASYTDLKDRIPSKLGRIVVDIPSGGHDVTVELLEPSRGSAEVHPRIPEPTVGNEE